MQIYGRRSSINVQKVLWCLGELGRTEGRDFERIDAGLHFGVVDTPEYRKLNPNGLVPTLVDGDFVLWESNSVARYLAATDANGHALLPADPKARMDVERWMDWQLATFWSTLRVAFLGLTRTPEPQRNLESIRKAYGDASQMLVFVDHLLAGQPFLARSGFSLADICVGLSVHRWVELGERFADVLGERPVLPALAEWHRQLAARPAFQSTVA
jgi:glutathione S-transferase